MSDECTVCVLDDDQAAASSTAALLRSVGLKVETFNSAQDFLAEFDQSRCGCLVLDIRLQGMDGFEVQAALAADEVEIPIIMISGHADRETSNKALRNGAVACLDKPFDGEEFCEIVRAAMLQR